MPRHIINNFAWVLPQGARELLQETLIKLHIPHQFSNDYVWVNISAFQSNCQRRAGCANGFVHGVLD
ncbi:Unknown protein sequence [Pseudomonas syringae pv. maculicola]|nr:Unknown protein sequence [Pseudomonas syringae pv. maculicola]